MTKEEIAAKIVVLEKVMRDAMLELRDLRLSIREDLDVDKRSSKY